MQKISTSDICDFMHELEQELGLIDWKIKGINIWPVARMTIYYALTLETGLYQENIAAASEKRSLFTRLKSLCVQLSNAPFSHKGSAKYALYVHARKIDGKDIYSDPLLRQIKDDSLVLDSTYTDSERHGAAYEMGAFTLMAVLWRRFAMKCLRLTKEDEDMIFLIFMNIKKRFGVSIKVRNIILRKLYLFQFLKPVYKRLFRRKKIEHVYIVNAYSHHYITAAAQELGLPVTELQHGMITPYNMGYNYPGRDDVPYFPDEFWGFGEYWLNVAEMPKRTKKRVIGAPHIQALKDKNIEKKPKTVFFSSQTVIGFEMYEYALQVAEMLPHHTITLNLHPHDRRDKYPEIGLPENMQILYRPDHFFELLASHEFQVGSFSTTLFEGMVMGNKVIVLDLPGSENMQPVIERGDAAFAANPQELISYIKLFDVQADPEVYYAKPVTDFLQKTSDTSDKK